MFLISLAGTRRAASGASLAFTLAAHNRILQLPSLCSIYQGRCRICYQNVNKAESFHIQQSKRQLSKPMMSLSSLNVSKLTSLYPTVLAHFALFDAVFIYLHSFQPVTLCLALLSLLFFNFVRQIIRCLEDGEI